MAYNAYATMDKWQELKNTIVCSLSRVDDLKRHAPDKINVLGSSYFPHNVVYYIDNEGVLLIYPIEEDSDDWKKAITSIVPG